MAMDHIAIYRCCFLFAVALLIGVSKAYGDLHFKRLTGKEQSCDLFRGQWIFSPSDPPYSDKCRFLCSAQNCIKNHRPDRAYLHWRWKPYRCDLPLFDPEKFLNLMKNRVFAFIGDSIARNQKDSLLCLLSKVEEPLLVSPVMSCDLRSAWLFPSYNFTLLGMTNLFLLRAENENRHGVRKVHLDVLDKHWTILYHKLDYVVIGTGAWFDKPIFILENNIVIGCHNCEMEDVPELGLFYAYRRALSLAFRFIVASKHKPSVIYRSTTPRHFEHGIWSTGGYCNRTVPLKESDLMSSFKEDYDCRMLERIGREEYMEAVTAAGTTHGDQDSRVRLEMLDVYHLSLLRPDGHPNVYGGNGKHDCYHWCTPGVTDAWNDLMMEMIMRDNDKLRISMNDGGQVI